MQLWEQTGACSTDICLCVGVGGLLFGPEEVCLEGVSMLRSMAALVSEWALLGSATDRGDGFTAVCIRSYMHTHTHSN